MGDLRRFEGPMVMFSIVIALLLGGAVGYYLNGLEMRDKIQHLEDRINRIEIVAIHNRDNIEDLG